MSIVHSGYRGRKGRAWSDVLTVESLRAQNAELAGKYSRLHGAVLDFLEAKGLENEDGYLVRLEREVGRKR